MHSGKNNNSIESIFGTSGILMPGLLSLALLAILFSLPQPAVHVNLPFKVELLLSLFLIAFFVLMRRRHDAAKMSAAPWTIACAIGTFIVWSIVSTLWASSFNSVAHHTLLWSVYLIIFLIFTSDAWPDANIRFITTTFCIAALILGILCIFDYLTVVDFSSSEGDIRIRYGKYAEMLVTISPLLWAAPIYTRNRRRMIFILIVALLSWITVMLSLSKGAFISGIAGFVIFFAGSAVFSAKYFRKRVAAFAAIWLVLTIGTQVFFSFFSAVPSTTSYITGTADTTRSTSTMRIFTWRVAKQMAEDHWLTGVGADSFGPAFNPARIRFRETHSNDTSEDIAEDYIVERTHNEPLQVLSELGVIGLLLLSLVFILFAVSCIKNYLHNRRSSPILWAALAGMAAFAVSSQFSSFSFRSAQNGVVFFMVFAIAVIKMPKADRNNRTRSLVFSRPVYLLSLLAALLMAAFCLTKIFAEYHVYKAERAEIYIDAADHFRLALTADPTYAGAYLSSAARASKEGDPALAAAMTRKAIENGVGMTPIYSQLAKQHIASGNLRDAESTYREALSIYPRSIFIRTEFAVFLEKQNKPTEAAEQIAKARSIDLRLANGWYLLIREGSVTAFYRSQNDPNIAPPAELTPYGAVRQYVDKLPQALSAE